MSKNQLNAGKYWQPPDTKILRLRPDQKQGPSKMVLQNTFTFPELLEGERDLPALNHPPFISWFFRNRIIIGSHGIGSLNQQGCFMNQRHQFLHIYVKALINMTLYVPWTNKNVIKIGISWKQSEINFLWAVKIQHCTFLVTKFYQELFISINLMEKKDERLHGYTHL